MAEKPAKSPHVSPLRRSIRKRIEQEDVGEEFEADRLPFLYLLGKSIDKYIVGPGVTFDTPDDKDIVEIAARAIVFRSLNYVEHDVLETMRCCESPIEKTMFGALIAVAAKEDMGIRLRRSDRLPHFVYGEAAYKSRVSPSLLTITPQEQLGEYRVDFLLEFETRVVDYPPEAYYTERYEDGAKAQIITRPELGREITISKDIIIECDGHDFHEKTKTQAARDKKRDRLLQSIGYNVFRFTGSEIYNDAIGCANEVLAAFGAAVRKETPLRPDREPTIDDHIANLRYVIGRIQASRPPAHSKGAIMLADLQNRLRQLENECDGLGGV